MNSSAKTSSPVIDFLSNTLSSVTRGLAFIPGMYFFTKPLHDFFTRYYSAMPESAWRIISMNGYKLKLNIGYRMAALVYWRGAHEWAPLYLLNDILKEGMTLYDVGANMGEFTLYASARVGKTGKVVSFEPMKEMYQLLNENVRINNFNDRITLFNVGLSDKKQTADLYAASEVNERGSLEDGLHTLYGTKERSSFLHQISLEKLDEVVEANRLSKPDVMKIDVEGAELFVLKGGTAILGKYHPKILLEFNAETCEAAGYTQKDLLAFLQSFGYTFFIIGNRGKLSPLEMNNLPALTNLLCVHA